MSLSETNMKYINISSQDSSNPNDTPTDFGITFADVDLQHTKRMLLHSFTIPNYFYNVPAYKNTLIFYLGSMVGTPQTIVVPPGQYTTAQLMAYLQTQLMLYFLGGVTVTQDPFTNLITINIIGGNTISIASTDTNALSTLAPVLGYTISTAYLAVNTANTIPSLEGETFVTIHSDTYASGKTRDAAPPEGALTNEFARTGITVPYGFIQYYKNSEMVNDLIVFNPPVNFTSSRFRIRNFQGQLLTLPPNSAVQIVLKCYY